jgi:hypothetical protein
MTLKSVEIETGRLIGLTEQLSENLKTAHDRIDSLAQGETKAFKLTLIFLTAIIGVLGVGATLVTYIQVVNNEKVQATTDLIKKQFDEAKSELKSEVSTALKQNRNEIDKFLGLNTLVLKDIRSAVGAPDVLLLEPSVDFPEGGSKNYRYTLKFYYEMTFEGEGTSKVIGTRNYYDGPFLDVIDDKESPDSFVQRIQQGVSIVQNDSSVAELLPASIQGTLTMSRKTCDAIAKIDAGLRALPSLGSFKVVPSFERVQRPFQGKTLKLLFDKRPPPVTCTDKS